MVVKKISELVPKGAPLGNTDLLVVGVDNGTDYDLKSVTGAELLGNVITQTITNGDTSHSPSSDVVYDSLALKVDKVTGKGLSTEDYTSAEKTKLSGLTGTNTGDQTLQTVTNLGNTTTNAVISATATFVSQLTASQIQTSRISNSKRSSLNADGYVSLSTTGTSEATLKASNILNDVTLEFPNKSIGSYTIATTTDLTAKVDSNTAITGATKTKITYDSKGLVTSGADATTADIADSSNKRYVTDANLTTIGNQSGTNTGDETVTTIKTKLGITTLSGSNTGDQDLSTLVVKNTAITGATKTKITYDSKGLVTSGADATTSDIADSLNKRYVTDANLTTIGNTSGTNTGDQTISDATITTTDITTNNVSSTKHGFVPKTPNNTTTFLRGDGTWATPSAGGLTYFTEAQNTTAPNATVPVDSLTAVSGTTNGDFAIMPKGTGAILTAIPDSTSTGGNKRGIYAIDFQRVRPAASYVASGSYATILNGQNNTASGNYSFSHGLSCNASGAYSFCFGDSSSSLGIGSFAFGSSTAAGAGSFAISGATVNGTNSFGIAGGQSSGNYSFAIGNCTASADYTFAQGSATTASGGYSSSWGVKSNTFNHASRKALGCLAGDASINASGYAQRSWLNVATNTNSTTPKSLNAYNGTPGYALRLENNNAMRVKGSIIGKQTASTNVGAWDFDCVIVRGATAGTTVIASSNVNLVVNTGGFGSPTLTANTTEGSLDVKVTGLSGISINWNGIIDSCETIIA